MDAAQRTLGRWLPHGTDLILSLISSGIPMCPQTMSQILPRRVFVTVGSTRFDALVQAVLTPQVIDVLKSKMFAQIVVQCGESDLSGVPVGGGSMVLPLVDGETRKGEVHGIQVELFKFRPSLEDEYDKASLIIGHGGSGTILSALKRRKPILVIPNPTLADNHQQELADIISKNKQNVAVCGVQDLAAALHHLKDPRQALALEQQRVAHQQQQRQQQQGAPQQPTGPPVVGQRFASIMDETMGFAPR